MAIELFANDAQTSLSGAITAGAATLIVASAAGLPAASAAAVPPTQFRVRVEDAPAGSGVNLEFMTVTDVAGTTLTVARGQEGTAAVAHGDGSAVTMVATAAGLTALPQNMVGAGTLAARPAAADVPAGYEYLATDDDGGTLYRSNGVAWIQKAAGVLETGGRELAYAKFDSANYVTTTTAATDMAGLSISFTAGARPVAVRFGATDMQHSVANAIGIIQAVRTDTGGVIAMMRGTHATANGRVPVGTHDARLSGLTPGNSYTCKLQTVMGSAGTLTIPASADIPIWIQAVEL